ncbi:MAG: hypothetical protein ABSD20_01765 [Terriglobales bacterium]|jgi:hypothetical protein
MPRRLRLYRSVRWFYRCLAGFSCAYFLLIAIASVLVRHGAALGLPSVMIGQDRLPYFYHSGSMGVRADHLVTDFFINLLSSPGAVVVIDVLAVLWIVGILTAPAWLVQSIRQRRRNRNTRQMPPAPPELRPLAVVGGRDSIRRKAKIIKFPEL